MWAATFKTVNNVVRNLQNPPQILPKSIQNLFKSSLRKKMHPKRVPKFNFWASWTLLGEFLKGPRGSVLNFTRFWAVQIELKITKKRSKGKKKRLENGQG